MRHSPLPVQAIARATGCVVVAAAITAIALDVRHDNVGVPAPERLPTSANDPLALELARCQAIGMAAKDDAACDAAWAENRRRFFGDRPARGATSKSSTNTQPGIKREDR